GIVERVVRRLLVGRVRRSPAVAWRDGRAGEEELVLGPRGRGAGHGWSDIAVIGVRQAVDGVAGRVRVVLLVLAVAVRARRRQRRLLGRILRVRRILIVVVVGH